MSEIPDNHGLFVYDSDDAFVDRIASFVGQGIEEGEVGIAVVSQRKWSLLSRALGDGAQRVRHRARRLVYVRPEATIATYDALVNQLVEEGASTVRLFGELPIWTSPDRSAAWELYEAVLNRAFADRPVSMICGYDTREQPAASLDGAWRTHPRVLADAWEDNPRYEDPAHLVAALTPRAQSVAGLLELPVDLDREAFRARLRRELADLRVAPAHAEKLVLAATEVFNNATAHGHGARSQRVGRLGGLIVWELSDNGPGFDDPLAGYLPPGTANASGSGLWQVRQLTRRVQFLALPAGFTTRLWV